MTRAELSPTDRTSIQRGKQRARTDRAELYATLDAGLVCHLGVQVDGAPRVLPTGYGRIDDTLYLHGSSGARSLRAAIADAEICVTVTLLDAVVYSRSMFDHSMNYRSAMVHGRPREVTGADEKWLGLRAITEQLSPGSWEHARQPTKRELAATTLMALPLDEAAVKVRTGGPSDEDADIAAASAWAGVLPLHQHWGEPEPCPQLPAGIEVPEHVATRKAP